MRRLLSICVIVCVLLVPSSLGIDFSFVIVPDEHLDQQPQDCTWVAKTQYLVANRTAMKTAAVLSSGDFTYLDRAWSTTSCPSPSGVGGWTIINAVLPWIQAPGNHDYDSENPVGRGITGFNTQVGYSRSRANYGYCATAGYQSNQWLKVDVVGRKFLIFALEFFPRPTALSWVDAVLATGDNSAREKIIVTHSYTKPGATYTDATLVADGDTYGPDYYKLTHGTPGPDNYSGVDLEAWAATRGFALILCGHWIGGISHGYRVDTRTDGGNLHGIFSNWQTDVSPSERVVILDFTGNTLTVSNLNTTTGVIDAAIFPPYTVTWEPVRKVWFGP